MHRGFDDDDDDMWKMWASGHWELQLCIHMTIVQMHFAYICLSFARSAHVVILTSLAL